MVSIHTLIASRSFQKVLLYLEKGLKHAEWGERLLRNLLVQSKEPG